DLRPYLALLPPRGHLAARPPPGREVMSILSLPRTGRGPYFATLRARLADTARAAACYGYAPPRSPAGVSAAPGRRVGLGLRPLPPGAGGAGPGLPRLPGAAHEGQLRPAAGPFPGGGVARPRRSAAPGGQLRHGGAES